MEGTEDIHVTRNACEMFNFFSVTSDFVLVNVCYDTLSMLGDADFIDRFCEGHSTCISFNFNIIS